jgi:Cu(I)/Ag(I) efflux system membrane fusion protein
VIDLSKVWGVFDAYESDLPWISMNQKVDFITQAIPGKTFSGKISFIDPVVNPTTRIVSVRIELGNPGLILKPEMFINGTIHSTLKGNGEQLTIPQTAVLWTGTRSVVYVKTPDAEHPSFKLREITLGTAMKDTYVVADGLAEGEEIVTNGTFSVDAAAQLAGKTSMMNPSGEKVSSGSMPGMDMSSSNSMDKSEDKVNLSHVMVKVGGECEMCKDRIETAAKSVPGVESANWEIDIKKLHLNFDSSKTSSDEIQKAIAKVGHDTEKFKAPDAIYKELPECCLYERFNY